MAWDVLRALWRVFIDATSNALHWQDEVNTDYGSGLRVLLELESLATNFSTKKSVLQSLSRCQPDPESQSGLISLAKV